MTSCDKDEIEELKRIIEGKNREILDLRGRLGDIETKPESKTNGRADTVLDKSAILRYSRQMLLPEFRASGQLSLLGSSALVVGCGGLGCPAAMYLASAGVGTLGLLDYDQVEESNLHRQIGHSSKTLGMHKADSLASTCSALNPNIRVQPHKLALDSSSALEVIQGYDVVLDCTDNVATRYLLNDACVLSGKPLVSGSALRWEGQLTVYNYQGTGPTYRCLYPTPPPAGAVTNCSEGGVMGPVPGAIGSLQALEAIKIMAGLQPAYSGALLLMDGLEGRQRTVKLRPRRPEATAQIRGLIDYVQFCGSPANDKDNEPLSILDAKTDRITPQIFKEKLKSPSNTCLDVRTEPEFEMCKIPNTINIPISILKSIEDGKNDETVQKLFENKQNVYIICRRGNDSQVAVKILRHTFPSLEIKDVKGGLHQWASQIDPDFPIY